MKKLMIICGFVTMPLLAQPVTNYTYSVTTTSNSATGVVTTNTNKIPASVTIPLTNGFGGASSATSVTPSALTGLSGLETTIINQLVDDGPYVTNATVDATIAVLYNESNPKGKGKVGLFGDITFPTTQQSSVGIGLGEMAHHSFITPVTFTVGTTFTNLPAAIGKVYTFIGDGLLYDFTGKQAGNWVNAGFFKDWHVNNNLTLGVKFGTYNDSVIPGIGWFGAITGTF